MFQVVFSSAYFSAADELSWDSCGDSSGSSNYYGCDNNVSDTLWSSPEAKKGQNGTQTDQLLHAPNGPARPCKKKQGRDPLKKGAQTRKRQKQGAIKAPPVPKRFVKDRYTKVCAFILRLFHVCSLAQ